MIAQIFLNSIISGLLLALVALGFNIIFLSTNIFHIAHGGIYVAGVYFFYFFYPLFGFLISLFLTIILAILLGVLIEWSIYKPLSKKANNQNIALISSLGIYIILVNLIAMFAGNETKLLSNTLDESFQFGNLIITHPQFYQILFSIPLIFLFVLFLKYTGFGLKIRAVANNSVLAAVVGIKIQKVRYLVFGLGSLMAVSAALLKAYDTGIDPYAGMTITLSAAVVVIIGGSNSLYGTILASLLLAIIQNFTEYFLTSEWKDTITFTILIIVMLWRTEGILQFNIRADER